MLNSIFISGNRTVNNHNIMMMMEDLLLHKLSRKELQTLAKTYGIKANASNAVLIEKIEFLRKKVKTSTNIFIAGVNMAISSVSEVEELSNDEESKNISKLFKVGEAVLLISSNSQVIVKRINKHTLRVIEENGYERSVSFSDCKSLNTGEISVIEITDSDRAVESSENEVAENSSNTTCTNTIVDTTEPNVNATELFDQTQLQEEDAPVITENITASAMLSAVSPFQLDPSIATTIPAMKAIKKSAFSALIPRSNRAEEVRRQANLARALPSSIRGKHRRETMTNALSVSKRTPLSVSTIKPICKKVTSSLHHPSTTKSLESFTGRSNKDARPLIQTTNSENVILII